MTLSIDTRPSSKIDRARIRQTSWCCILLFSFASSSFAQDRPTTGDPKPEAIRSFTAQELADENARLRRVEGPIDDEIQEAMSVRAAELVLSLDFSDPAESGKVRDFINLAGDKLTELQILEIRKRIASGPSDFERFTFTDIRRHIQAMEKVEAGSESRVELLSRWVSDELLTQLTMSEIRWLLRKSLPQQGSRNDFSVTWNGLLIPPRDGQYALSFNDININALDDQDEDVKLTVSVTLDGREIIDASAESWDNISGPLDLVGQSGVPITVSFRYSASRLDFLRPPAALLFWEGPGIAKQIIPASAFRLANADGAGLAAEYSWPGQAGRSTSSRVDANIEFGWTSSRNITPEDPELTLRLTDELYRRCTAADYLDECASSARSGEPQVVHEYCFKYDTTEYLSCAQRQQFLQLLRERPALFNGLDRELLVRLLKKLRIGAGEETIDLIGIWMQENSSRLATPTADFVNQNRKFYEHICSFLSQQDPQAYRQLQENYLQNEDGGCYLQSAFAIGHCYLYDGRIRDWVAELDKRLADDKLAGDQRATWLLARAYAAGLYGTMVNNQHWIDEARLIAESDTMRLMAEQSNLLQMINELKFARTYQHLDAVAPGFSATEARTTLVGWRQAIREIEDHFAKVRQQERIDEKLAHQAMYRRQLEKYRASALQRGDAQAAARFQGFIEDLPDQP